MTSKDAHLVLTRTRRGLDTCWWSHLDECERVVPSVECEPNNVLFRHLGQLRARKGGGGGGGVRTHERSCRPMLRRLNGPRHPHALTRCISNLLSKNVLECHESLEVDELRVVRDDLEVDPAVLLLLLRDHIAGDESAQLWLQRHHSRRHRRGHRGSLRWRRLCLRLLRRRFAHTFGGQRSRSDGRTRRTHGREHALDPCHVRLWSLLSGSRAEEGSVTVT